LFSVEPSIFNDRRDAAGPMLRRDFGLLLAFCLVLFGVGMYGGRPLTMHESVLAQSSREMLASGDWLVPTSGGRPWLERPPLPQWITAGFIKLFGDRQHEAVVRLGAALAGTWTVLVAAWIAQFFYGRWIGIYAGLSLATMVQFHRYSTLCEQDIFLAAIVATVIAWFLRCEFGVQPKESANPFGTRSGQTLLFFVLLSQTNLVKGLAFGTAMVLVPIGLWGLWNFRWRTLWRWAWLWGWLLYVGVSAVWPIAVWNRFPDVVELWNYDLGGRLSGSYTNINQPWWYYPAHLCYVTLPWTPLAFFGAWLAWRNARRDSPERFLLCWAVGPVIVFSFASGKHHHYMIHFLAPWAMFAAKGLCAFHQSIARRWQEGSWIRRLQSKQALTASFASLALAYVGVYSFIGWKIDKGRHDYEFFVEARKSLPPAGALVVNADLHSMDVFRILFYMPAAEAVHNLTYLRHTAAKHAEVFVVTCQRDEPGMKQLGTLERLMQSVQSRREISPDFRLGLYRLRFSPTVEIAREALPVSPMQAMGRKEGPFLGRPL
jgi:4-amino-4-deoxy-L-arabinose transferase-like glycosyltransferase